LGLIGLPAMLPTQWEYFITAKAADMEARASRELGIKKETFSLQAFAFPVKTF